MQVATSDSAKHSLFGLIGRISYNAKSIPEHLYLWGLLRKGGFGFEKDLCKAQSIRPICGRDLAWV